MNLRQLQDYDRRAIRKSNQTLLQLVGESPCPQDRSLADLLLVHEVAHSIHVFINSIEFPHINLTKLDKRLLDNLFEVLDFQLRPPMS